MHILYIICISFCVDIVPVIKAAVCDHRVAVGGIPEGMDVTSPRSPTRNQVFKQMFWLPFCDHSVLNTSFALKL